MPYSLQKYLTEFFCTFILVWTILWAVQTDFSYTPWLIFAVLTLIIYAGGPISKAHYNPCTTVTFQGRRQIHSKEILGYYISIFSGAILATILISWVLPFEGDSTWKMDLVKGSIGEFLGTFLLLWVIMYVATLERTVGNLYYGVAIAGAVLIGIFLFGSVSRAAFNPAVALSFYLSDMMSLPDLLLTVAAEVLAAFSSYKIFNRVYGVHR